MKKHSLLSTLFAQLFPIFVCAASFRVVSDDGPAVADEKILGALDKVGKKQDQILGDYDRLSKETKSAFEDLTKVKNKLNSLDEFMLKMKQVEIMLRREQRMAYGDPVKRISSDEKLRTQFNLAVRCAVNPDGKFTRSIDTLKKALGEDSSPGSTLIVDDLATEIYDTLARYGVWNTFRVYNLGTKITKLPVKTARPVANVILTEGGTIADDTTKAGTSVSLEVEIIAALLNVSIQLLEDSEFDVTADVLDDFIEAFNFRLDHLALNATGAADATHGGMTGIFQGGTAAAAASGNTTTETLDLEDFTRCLTTVDPAVLSRPARWWMHPQILARTLAVKDLNGRPIFLTATEAPSPGGIGSILGYPLTLSHAAPATNAASAKLAVFGDPGAMSVGVRRDFVFEASDHHRWNTLERCFRGWGRAGTKIRRAQGLAVLTAAAS